MLRFWLQDSVPPRGGYDERPGRWAAEADWPSPRVAARAIFLTPRRSRADAGDGARSPLSAAALGADAGVLAAYGNPADLPADQRDEDAWSLCFDSQPLAAPSTCSASRVCISALRRTGRSRSSRRASATSRPTAPPP